MHAPPLWDNHWEGIELAAHAGWRWIVLDQLSNFRLVGMPPGPDGEWSWEFGWYNRDRCEHGAYDAECQTVGCPAWRPTAVLSGTTTVPGGHA